MKTILGDIAFAGVAAVVLVAISLAAQRLLSGMARRAAPAGPGNVAEALVTASHLFGVFVIAAAVISGCARGVSLVADATWTAIFGVTAVLLLSLTARLGTSVILGARLGGEIERGNAAAGVAAAGHHLATALIIASCLYGTDLSSLGISLAFFAIAQITLHLFVAAFRVLTTYDDGEEIRGENLAAALSYAGMTVALGIIIAHAADGTFVSFGDSLRGYAVALVASLALYPVRQLVVGALLGRGGVTLRGGRLDTGISRERDVGLGILEATAYLAAAAFVTRIA